MTRETHVARTAAGLTLLEVLMVVVILSIVAGMVGMTAGENGEQALELAEIQVRDAVERAQALALSSRSPHAVVFDTASDRFAVIDAIGQPAIDPLTKRSWIVDFVRPNQPKLVEIDSANFGPAGQAAIFDAQGVPLAGGTLTLRYANLTHTLVLDAATGWLE